MDIGRMFITFLLIIFGLALTPTIGDSVYGVLWNDTNVSVRVANNITNAAARSIISLIPLVWVFIVIGIGAAAVVNMFEDMQEYPHPFLHHYFKYLHPLD